MAWDHPQIHSQLLVSLWAVRGWQSFIQLRSWAVLGSRLLTVRDRKEGQP